MVGGTYVLNGHADHGSQVVFGCRLLLKTRKLISPNIHVTKDMLDLIAGYKKTLLPEHCMQSNNKVFLPSIFCLSLGDIFQN